MARCQWCTAPLPSHASLCRYCGRRSDVDLRGVHEFTVAVPQSERICPACDVPMQTLDLGLDGTFYIERCEKCLSLFFDTNEIETLLEKTATNVFQVDHRRLGEMLGAEGGPRREVRYYRCPVCRTTMNRVNFGARSGVIVDQCPDHGMWLQSGELRRLLEWRKAGGQIHDLRCKAERIYEERKEQRRKAREAARAGREAGAFFPEADEGYVSLPDPAETVQAFVKAVLRLFR